MLCVSLQGKTSKFQEESSDLETLLLELGFLCENVADPDALLESVNVKLCGAATATNFVQNIDYDCKLPQNLRQEACGMKGDMVFRKWAIATIIIFSQKGNRNN